jgi:hypothetical protein
MEGQSHEKNHRRARRSPAYRLRWPERVMGRYRVLQHAGHHFCNSHAGSEVMILVANAAWLAWLEYWTGWKI